MSDRSTRIRELEAELEALRGEEPRPMTLAEIRALSPEEVEVHWERVRRTILADQEGPVTPMERLRRAYGGAEGADALASGAAVREARRNKGGGDGDDAA
jgi:hypothetical protein